MKTKKPKRLKKDICEQVHELLEPALQNIGTARSHIPESHPDFALLGELWQKLCDVTDRYNPNMTTYEGRNK
jgi:hypothetical protein